MLNGNHSLGGGGATSEGRVGRRELSTGAEPARVFRSQSLSWGRGSQETLAVLWSVPCFGFPRSRLEAVFKHRWYLGEVILENFNGGGGAADWEVERGCC